jgi:hypothetical protein
VLHHVTSLRSRLLQQKDTPLFTSVYQKILHVCQKQATQRNSTVLIVTPVFPHYITFVTLHYTRYSISLRYIQRALTAVDSSTNAPTIMQYSTNHKIQFMASTKLLHISAPKCNPQTPEQRNIRTVRLHTWISVLELYVFVITDFLKMAHPCRNM